MTQHLHFSRSTRDGRKIIQLKKIVLSRLWLVWAIAAISLFRAYAQMPVSDPIPEPITKTGLSVEIQDFVQIPASSNSIPLARINLLKTANDNSNRLFVNDLRGILYLVNGNSVNAYLDLAAQTPDFVSSPGLGTGFGSFAFHPEFATNGKFYTTHAEAAGSGSADLAGPVQGAAAIQGVITEWTAADPAANVFSGTRRELLRIDIPGTIHGLQDMAFNPNAETGNPDYGMLYICLGDGGSTIAGIPDNTHRLDSILGTILRIDPAGNNGRNGQYGIPGDNPFVDGDSSTLDEIWAWGFRNPHRISWDTGGDGKMLIGGIGERNIEEVNLGISGADYGWNLREGTFLFDPNGDNNLVFPLPGNDSTFGYTYPVAQYDHDEGFAIVGGFVYRGTDAPELIGKYIFGDIANGRIFYTAVDEMVNGSQATIHELTLTQNGSEVTVLELLNNNRADLRFGLDANGELYLLTKIDGMIRKIVSSAIVGISDVRSTLPGEFTLLQNYPNPFNPETVIEYEIPVSAKAETRVILQIYSVNGQLIRTLVNERKNSGSYKATWDGHNDAGEQVASGVYFYQMRAGNFSKTKKITLLR